MTRKARKVWSHQGIAQLILTYQQGGELSVDASYAAGDGVKSAKAKLIELNFMPKPDEEQLAIEVHQDIETFISEIASLEPRQRVLAARATIQAVRDADLLPKRAAKVAVPA